MTKEHEYTCRIDWTGNRGEGTKTYRRYDRTWDVATAGKPVVRSVNFPVTYEPRFAVVDE